MTRTKLLMQWCLVVTISLCICCCMHCARCAASLQCRSKSHQWLCCCQLRTRYSQSWWETRYVLTTVHAYNSNYLFCTFFVAKATLCCGTCRGCQAPNCKMCGPCLNPHWKKACIKLMCLGTKYWTSSVDVLLHVVFIIIFSSNPFRLWMISLFCSAACVYKFNIKMFHPKSNYVNDKCICSMHVAMHEWWKYWDQVLLP